jgi:hypothetical protein
VSSWLSPPWPSSGRLVPQRVDRIEIGSCVGRLEPDSPLQAFLLELGRGNIDGRAHRALVERGHQTGKEAEVVSGVTDSTAVIVHPGDLVRDGVRITDRNGPRAAGCIRRRRAGRVLRRSADPER